MIASHVWKLGQQVQRSWGMDTLDVFESKKSCLTESSRGEGMQCYTHLILYYFIVPCAAKTFQTLLCLVSREAYCKGKCLGGIC